MMTAREQEIYDEIWSHVPGEPLSDSHVIQVWEIRGILRGVAAFLARLEQQKPGAAGEQLQHWWVNSGLAQPPRSACGASGNKWSEHKYVTCPACLKLMRDGTGKEPAPPAPTIKEMLGKVAAEDADMCVCGHPRSDHYYRGGVSACAVAGCACGPGCIHEGFVRADGVIEPAPPTAPEPGKSRGEEVAEKMVQMGEHGAHKNLLWLRGYRAEDGGQIIYPGLEIPECLKFLRRFVADIINAERAAAAGEARRKALEEIRKWACLQQVAYLEEAFKKINLPEATIARYCRSALEKLIGYIDELLDPAAAPAGEGSKANAVHP